MDELDALLAFVVAAAVTLACTPLTAALARRAGAVAEPHERGLNDRPVATLGGVAILAGALVAALLFLPKSAETWGIVGGAVAMTTVGALDDAFDLPPAAKLAGQALAALIPVAAGVYVVRFTLPFLDPVDLGDLGRPITLLGIVAVVNVVNFSDGVDGLAAGVCTIAGVTFAVIALSLDRTEAGILAALTAGAALGFLRHNFPPAASFMGDSGSHLLGLLLACVAIQGVLKTAAVVALFFPMIVLAVPLFDTGFVIAKRLKYGRPVWRGDRWHLHHRFDNIGFSQRRTLLYLYGWTLSLAALALALRFVPYSDDMGHFYAGWTAVIVGFGVLAFAASLYLVYVLEILKFRRFRERQLRRQVETGEMPALSEREIEEEIAREVETGEFEAVRPE